MRFGGKDYNAARWGYEHFVGPIPKGIHVLHKCDVGLCVNPAHLFLGTHQDNMADMKKKGRGAGPHSLKYKKTCPKGHSYNYVAKNGYRYCTICRNEYAAKNKERLEVARKKYMEENRDVLIARRRQIYAIRRDEINAIRRARKAFLRCKN